MVFGVGFDAYALRRSFPYPSSFFLSYCRGPTDVLRTCCAVLLSCQPEHQRQQRSASDFDQIPPNRDGSEPSHPTGVPTPGVERTRCWTVFQSCQDNTPSIRSLTRPTPAPFEPAASFPPSLPVAPTQQGGEPPALRHATGEREARGVF